MSKEQIENRKPKRIVVETILKYSQDENFENARHEWELVRPIEPTDHDFTDHCELCNAPLSKVNWEIQNIYTKVTLKVGSECIKRFVVLHGTGTQEDTVRYMSNVEKEWGKVQEAKLLYREVVKQDRPPARSLNRFCKILKEILENRGYYPLPDNFGIDDLKPIYESVFGFSELPSKKEQWMLYQILYDPSKIPVTRDKRPPRFKQQYKEGETLWKKRRVTYVTLSRSSAYRPDRNI